MSDHVPRKGDEGDDEDLELLRIAALKSINSKKEHQSQYHRSPSSRPPTTIPSNTHSPQKISSSYSTIPVKRSGSAISSSLSHENKNILTVPAQPYYPAPVHSLRLEQLDINEPYVPQRVPPIPTVVQAPMHGPNGAWVPEPAPVVSTIYTPYVPQKVVETHPVNMNVQLSPRSMAFVSQNNDILMRRKGENISPNYAYRSPSPPYRKSSPGRWSKSPSPAPKANSRSPVHRDRDRGRMHHYPSHRRSSSRSPLMNIQRSPLPRRRSASRSPPLRAGQHLSRHQSPNPFHRYPSRSPTHMRRMRSRSPPSHNGKRKISPQRRPISRSPLPHNGRPHSRSPPPSNGRRSPALLPRHPNRARRSLSPSHNRKRSPINNQFHEVGDGPQRYHPNRDRRSPPHMNVHRRSLSPLPPLPRQRSHSRSPQRRYMRKSRERNVNANLPPRRRSPFPNRRRYEPNTNGFRNNVRGRKRSLTPSNKDRPVRKSRTRSPDRVRLQNKRPRRNDNEDRRSGYDDYHRNDPRRNDDRRPPKQVPNLPNIRRNERDRDGEETKPREVIANAEQLTPPEEKAAKEVNNAQPANIAKESPEPEVKTPEPLRLNTMEIDKHKSSEDEDEDNDDDGIDLFASEDSESENEGRFKSSTSKNERTTQAPTVSFTKLGETRPVEVKQLTDIDSGGNRDRGRCRDRDRVDRSRNNYGRSRGAGGSVDRFRNADNGRRSRERDRRDKNNTNNTKNRRDRDRDRERERERDRGEREWDSSVSKPGDEKKSNSSSGSTDRPMFKSTFQALESEGRSSRKSSRDRETTDRRLAVNSKRRNTSKDRRVSPEAEADPPSGPSLNLAGSNSSSRATSPSSRAATDNGVSGKKPIHLRLGAKTNTFKPAKKTSGSPWNASHGNGSTEKV